MSLRTSRLIGERGFEASIMPIKPPIDVPIQSIAGRARGFGAVKKRRALAPAGAEATRAISAAASAT
jgi:hypothetical protein